MEVGFEEISVLLGIAALMVALFDRIAPSPAADVPILPAHAVRDDESLVVLPIFSPEDEHKSALGSTVFRYARAYPVEDDQLMSYILEPLRWYEEDVQAYSSTKKFGLTLLLLSVLIPLGGLGATYFLGGVEIRGIINASYVLVFIFIILACKGFLDSRAYWKKSKLTQTYIDFLNSNGIIVRRAMLKRVAANSIASSATYMRAEHHVEPAS